MGERDSQGVWDGHVHTIIFRMDNQKGPGWDGRGVWGRMGTCICMTEPLCCSPETITTLLTGCTSVQNAELIKRDQRVKTTKCNTES